MDDLVFCCRDWLEKEVSFPLANQWSIPIKKFHIIWQVVVHWYHSDSVAVDFSHGAKSHCSNMSLCHRSRAELEFVHDSTCIPCYAPLVYRVVQALFFFFTAVPVFYTLNEWDREIVELEILDSFSTLKVFIAMICKGRCAHFSLTKKL